MKSLNTFAQILAISGVNEYLLIALQKRSGEILERVGQSHFAHGEQIAGVCDAILSEAALPLAALDAIAIDLGPGSFTGQRISLSFAKGLGLALGKPLVGLDSFSIWHGVHSGNQNAQSPDNNDNNVGAASLFRGEPCKKNNPALIVIDGRKRRFYAQLRAAVAKNGGETQQSKPGFQQAPSEIAELYSMTWDLSPSQLYQMLVKQNFTSKLSGEGHVLRLGGPGVRLFQSELAKTSPPENCPIWQAIQAAIPPIFENFRGSQSAEEPGIFKLLAQNMLSLAQKAHAAKSYMKASDGPFYLRKSDAQEHREKQEQHEAQQNVQTEPARIEKLGTLPRKQAGRSPKKSLG